MLALTQHLLTAWLTLNVRSVFQSATTLGETTCLTPWLHWENPCNKTCSNRLASQQQWHHQDCAKEDKTSQDKGQIMTDLKTTSGAFLIQFSSYIYIYNLYFLIHFPHSLSSSFVDHLKSVLAGCVSGQVWGSRCDPHAAEALETGIERGD